MQAIILAAGKSTRTYPLTVNTPKPLLKIIDKSILEHNLEALTNIVDEIIIIVGFKKELIKKAIGKKYKNIAIKYITQKSQLGTGHAITYAKKHIKDRFLILNGDDLYSKKDIKNCIKNNFCILGKKVDDPEKWGIIETEKSNLKNIKEKPKNLKKGLANTGLYIVNKDIFDIKLKKSKRNEYELTDTITEFAKNNKIKVEKVKDYWLPIGYPWHYLEANVFFLKRLKKRIIKGKIEKRTIIKGKIILEKGATIKAGSYIEGPVYIGKNTEIGPLAHIRPDVVIQDNCKIGKSELFDCVIMKNTTCKHRSYIGHSVIGENVNIGAGLITSDYRHDGKNHTTLIKGEKIDSGRRKLGTFIGNHVKTGIGTLIYPGRKLWPGKTTLPGEVVKKDKD